MRTSRKWMQQYVDVAQYNNEEIAKMITAAGLEVEAVEYFAQGTNLEIGQIVSFEAHPDSDHLNVCQVQLHDGIQQIVCGAPNVELNAKVIVARVGAKLPEINIKASKVRGVESNGMLCSLLELGVDEKVLSEEQKAGIELLASEAPVGENPLTYLGLDDVIFDIGLTPNRNDCLAGFAFMKELGAIFKQKVSLPDLSVNYTNPTSELTIAVTTPKAPSFLGTYVGGIKVGPSIEWISNILKVANIKPINNVVDISNLVMLETGQPLHFYDADKLNGLNLSAREGYAGTFLALDGKEYQIEAEDIMIYNNDEVVGIAGIMGGENTKVLPSTTNLVIEAAQFNHVQIRNTSRRLGLQTDASIRFQKGLDASSARLATQRAISLLVKYAGAEVVEMSQGEVAEAGLKTVTIDAKMTNKLLGTSYELAEIAEVFTLLDFNFTEENGVLNVEIPSYRRDLVISQDLIEEVIRLKGFDSLESTLPKMEATLGQLTKVQKERRLVRSILNNQGLYEAITYTLVSDKEDALKVQDLGESVQLAQPMSEDRKIVRASILPSLLKCVANNNAYSVKDVALYEVSNVYATNHVQENLAIAMSGNRNQNRWLKTNTPSDFYAVKGLVEAILAQLGFDGTRIQLKANDDVSLFHPYRSAKVYLGKDYLGTFGELHPTMAKQFGLGQVAIAELNLSVLYNAKASKIKYTPISKYQLINRDLSLVVSEEVSAKVIIDAIYRSDKNLIQNVEIFDVYQGEHVEAGYKSIALSIILQAKDHTLTEQEIVSVMDKVIANLEKNAKAKLRG